MDDDDQFETGLDESGRLRLYTTCPAGHPTIQALTPVEWRDQLASRSVQFECLFCGTKWLASAMQRAAIAGELEP